MDLFAGINTKLSHYKRQQYTDRLKDALACGISTDRADRDRAENAIKRIRSAAGLSTLVPLVWLPSPLKAYEAIGLAIKGPSTCGRRVTKKVSTGSTGPSPLSDNSEVFLQRVSNRLRFLETVSRHIYTQAESTFLTKAREGFGFSELHENNVFRRLANADLGGQFDLSTLISYSPDSYASPSIYSHIPLDDHIELARSCGAWWNFEKIVFISERPTSLSFDIKPLLESLPSSQDRSRPWPGSNAGDPRLHCTTSAAVTYEDGFSVYALHGINVKAKYITDPDSLTPTEIDKERNAEVRRSLIELYGYEKYLRRSGAQIIHENPATGRRLWWKMGEEPSGSGWGSRAATVPIVMVEVENSTPEPDGSKKRYFLRVPPEMRDADTAIAWTFRMTKEQYKLIKET